MDYERLLALGRDLLVALGEDPDRPGLLDTPRRWANMWREFIEHDPGRYDTVFESISTGQLVVVSGMRVYSLCEHHLMPFWCDITIGYIPNGQVLGLSKFGRVAHLFAHRLQLQEQLVDQIAQTIRAISHAEDVAVLGVGEHTCMSARGIRTPATMRSVAAYGAFSEPERLRVFLEVAK